MNKITPTFLGYEQHKCNTNGTHKKHPQQQMALTILVRGSIQSHAHARVNMNNYCYVVTWCIPLFISITMFVGLTIFDRIFPILIQNVRSIL